MLQLSPQAVRYIIEALTYYQTVQEERCRDVGATAEEVSDLTNDQHFLEAIKADLHRYHEELVSKGSTPLSIR